MNRLKGIYFPFDKPQEEKHMPSSQEIRRAKIKATSERFESLFGHPPLFDLSAMTSQELRAQKRILKGILKDHRNLRVH
jgi:hypothetical protein